MTWSSPSKPGPLFGAKANPSTIPPELASAEWVLIVGESGSGKSSLMSRLASTPSKSDVRWLDLSLVYELGHFKTLKLGDHSTDSGSELRVFFDGLDESPLSYVALRQALLSWLENTPAEMRARLRLTVAVREGANSEFFQYRLDQIARSRRAGAPGLTVHRLPNGDDVHPLRSALAHAAARPASTPAPELMEAAIVKVLSREGTDPSEPFRQACLLGAALVLGNKRLISTAVDKLAFDGTSAGLQYLELYRKVGLLVETGQGLRFAHWALAEFLAAKWLSALPSHAARHLLAPDRQFEIPGCPVALPLLPVATWLARADHPSHRWLLSEVSEDFLSCDRWTQGNDERAAIVEALLSMPADVSAISDKLGGLEHPGLPEQLRPWITLPTADRTFEASLLALRIAQANRVPELISQMVELVQCDATNEKALTLRIVAVQVIAAIDTEALQALVGLLSPRRAPSRLQSELLANLFPSALDGPALVKVLTALERAQALEDFPFLQHDLPEWMDKQSGESALAGPICNWLIEVVSSTSLQLNRWEGKLLSSAIGLAWRSGKDSQAREAALDLLSVLTDYRRHDADIEYPAADDHTDTSALEEWTCSALGRTAKDALEGSEDTVGAALTAWDRYQFFLRKLSAEHLTNLLVTESDETRATILDVWLWHRFSLDSDDDCRTVEAALDTAPSAGRELIRRRFGRFRGGPEAWERVRAAGRPHSGHSDHDAESGALRTKALLLGEPDPVKRWWAAIHLLTLRPGSDRVGNPWQRPLEELPGLANLDTATIALLESTASDFLRVHDPKTTDWWLTRSFPTLVFAGIRAAQLLLWRTAAPDLGLSRSIWTKWTPAFVALGDSLPPKHLAAELSRRAVQFAPEQCTRLLDRIDQHEDPAIRRSEAGRASELNLPALDTALVSRLRDARFALETDRELLSALLSRGLDAAHSEAIRRLSAPHTESRERRLNAVVAFMGAPTEMGNQCILNSLRSDPALTADVLVEIDSPFGIGGSWLAGLPARDLEWLFRTRVEKIRVTDAVEPAAGWLSSSEVRALGSGGWVFIEQLRARAMREDLIALERLVFEFGSDFPGLVRAFRDACGAYARRVWEGVPWPELASTDTTGPRRQGP